jgi:DNA-binding transcriptional ArsR family regulator
MSTTNSDQDTKALAHPTRVEILRLLLEGAEPLSAKHLSVKMDLPLGSVAYHVRVLRENGLLEIAGTRQRRGALQTFWRPYLSDTDREALAVVALEQRDHWQALHDRLTGQEPAAEDTP